MLYPRYSFRWQKEKKIKLDSYLFEGFLMSQIMVHHEKTHRNTFAVYSKHKLGIFLQKAKKKNSRALFSLHVPPIN